MTRAAPLSRRHLLTIAGAHVGAALLSGCATDPTSQTPGRAGGSAGPWRAGRGAGLPGALRQRILLLVELQGGNDGLNTLVPLDQPAYARLRPAIAIPTGTAIPLTPAQGLHPALRLLEPAYARGDVAIVNAVGYDRPNRSHFRSIEIWEQATDSDRYATQGWATRALAEHPVFAQRSADADGIVVGNGTIGPLAGPVTRLVTLREPQHFLAQSEALRRTTLRADAPDSLRHVVRTQNVAVAAADAVRRKVTGADRFTRRFGRDPFGRALAITADLLADGVESPVWKVMIGSFDTHADQLPRHAGLLGRLAAGLAAFRSAMIDLGRWNDTLIVTYSEFGRRAAENLSRGTDHGAAAPLFLLGGAVEGGVHGEAPDLEALVDGDIPASIDFRRIYAAILTRWWEQPVNFLVGDGRAPLPLTRGTRA